MTTRDETEEIFEASCLLRDSRGMCQPHAALVGFDGAPLDGHGCPGMYTYRGTQLASGWGECEVWQHLGAGHSLLIPVR